MKLNKAVTPKSYLKDNGWTQEQAARRLNVSQPYLNQVLNGKMQSRRLIAAVMRLGANPTPKKRPAYAAA